MLVAEGCADSEGEVAASLALFYSLVWGFGWVGLGLTCNCQVTFPFLLIRNMLHMYRDEMR